MGLRVTVQPPGVRAFLGDAVREGGATVVEPAEAEGVIWTSPTGGDALRALLRDHPGIRWVQLPWAGIETFLDVLDRTHTWTAGQGVYAEPVAEHALGLALAALRDLQQRARASAWSAPSGLSLLHARVTIVGAGGIATSLMRLLAPFRCAVTVVRRRAQPFEGAVRTVGEDGLLDAIADADVVFLAAAQTPRTRQLIDGAALKRMKPTAVLVNVARGGLIDTDALVHALDAGTIRGAALDVTDPEPLPAGHPLWSHPRCLITPHVANTPEMAVPLLSERVRENVRRYAAGAPLLGVVDVEAGY